MSNYTSKCKFQIQFASAMHIAVQKHVYAYNTGTINCGDGSCMQSIFYLAATRNYVTCNGDDACKQVTMFCGIPSSPLPSNYQLSDYDGHIEECVITLRSNAITVFGFIRCFHNIDLCKVNAADASDNFKESAFECELSPSGSQCIVQCYDAKACGSATSSWDCAAPTCSCTGAGCGTLTKTTGTAPPSTWMLGTTSSPTKSPSSPPSKYSTKSPSASPTMSPSSPPSKYPSFMPTFSPITSAPTSAPSKQPSASPANEPSLSPTNQPSTSPTDQPTGPPTRSPSVNPTNHPSPSPSHVPSSSPTLLPSLFPSVSPTTPPSVSTSSSMQPTNPTVSPTPRPTDKELHAGSFPSKFSSTDRNARVDETTTAKGDDGDLADDTHDAATISVSAIYMAIVICCGSAILCNIGCCLVILRLRKKTVDEDDQQPPNSSALGEGAGVQTTYAEPMESDALRRDSRASADLGDINEEEEIDRMVSNITADGNGYMRAISMPSPNMHKLPASTQTNIQHRAYSTSTDMGFGGFDHRFTVIQPHSHGDDITEEDDDGEEEEEELEDMYPDKHSANSGHQYKNTLGEMPESLRIGNATEMSMIHDDTNDGNQLAHAD